MTELEKLKAGLEYNFFDSDVFCTLTMDENKISLEGKHNNNEVFYNKI